jgi:hypothetical protein
MYKVIKGKRSSTSEVTDENETVRVVDQSSGMDVFEADSDSFFIIDGKPYRLGEIPEERLITELARKGMLR